jgi:hypothetical protein
MSRPIKRRRDFLNRIMGRHRANPNRAKLVLVGRKWHGPGFLVLDVKGSVYLADDGGLFAWKA